MKTKLFKVALVSTNTNSFGLYGMILVARDGESWEVAANSLNKRNRGDVIKGIDTHNFEIPRKLMKAPKAVIKKIWGTP